MMRRLVAKSLVDLDHEAKNDDKSLMPRQLRVDHPGALYHVMSRGDRRDHIFLDNASLVHLGAFKGANTNLHKWMRVRANENSADGATGT